jgi:hypothetical protein
LTLKEFRLCTSNSNKTRKDSLGFISRVYAYNKEKESKLAWFLAHPIPYIYMTFIHSNSVQYPLTWNTFTRQLYIFVWTKHPHMTERNRTEEKPRIHTNPVLHFIWEAGERERKWIWMERKCVSEVREKPYIPSPFSNRFSFFFQA